jgi:nuclear cap-binding protein subunit 2
LEQKERKKMNFSAEDQELLSLALNPTDQQKTHRMGAKESDTVYVGNLSFYTSEEQMWELFSKCGPVKRIIMGLNAQTKTPCGFAFVEYYKKEGANKCIKFLNGTRLDEMTIRTELDRGFQPGRQYGRASSGGQYRDEYRVTFDPKRLNKSEISLTDKSEKEEKMEQT